MKRRIPLAPAEGWTTLALVMLLCMTMALAMDDARWVLGRSQYLDLLWVAAIGGVLAGFIGPKVGWGRWLTYLAGSIFAALVVPLITGLAAFPNGGSIHDLYQATSDSVFGAYYDIAVLGLPSTIQYLHFIFIFGILVWGTSMFASYAVFGHHRPVNAVIVVGVVLIANMGLTASDELWFLVLYSLAALLLLIRAHVFDEQSEWLRRRIGDPASISSVYLRGGTIFIALAVTGSYLLTQTAASAPLAGAFDGVQDGLIGISRAVSRFLPTGGETRALGLTFGASTQVQQIWNTDNATALTIHRDPTDKGHYYWRAVVYDQIDLKGWSQTDSTNVVLPAKASIFAGLADDVNPTGLHPFTFTVSPVDFRGPTILSPGTPVEVQESSRLTYVGTEGYFATLERDGGTGPYTVTALTQVSGNDPGQLNESALEAAGTTYPPEISALYLQKVPGAMGDNAKKLEAKVKSQAKSQAPFDLAAELVDVLHSPPFTYAVDVRDLPCETLSTVECFATYTRGFCQYYAATMAVLMRDMGVPARIVEGFLPGTVDRNSGTETIPFSSAHAWVEVYFPGFGWTMFDPTGGGLSQVDPLPSGPPIASASPGSSLQQLPLPSGKPDVDPGALGAGSSVKPPSPPVGPFLAVGALLLVIVGLLAFVAWQRGPRGATSPDGAYGSVIRIASRFGFAPRPTQTVYEYAGSLSEVLPTARPELEMVAQAKVEAVYARQLFGEERMASLRAAQRRLRVSLLRLAFHRRERPRRR
jgi:transglutaminase-like putative cysteine protease